MTTSPNDKTTGITCRRLTSAILNLCVGGWVLNKITHRYIVASKKSLLFGVMNLLKQMENGVSASNAIKSQITTPELSTVK